MDREQLERALINADAAGDVEAAKVLARAILNMSEPAKPSRGPISEFGRQMGLTARAGAQGLGDIADFLALPFSAAQRAVGGPEPVSASSLIGRGATAIGLPEPETDREKMVSAGARTMAGVAAPISLARFAAPTTQLGQGLLSTLTTAPTAQLAAGGAGGAGVEAARQEGIGPIGQAATGLVAGMGAGMVPGMLSSAKSAVMGAMRPANTEQMVMDALTRAIPQGSKVTDISPMIRQQLSADIREAMKTGDLDQAALNRLVEYRLLGATPTRGTLTLDPAEVTRQKNLAKLGAGSNDPRLQQLARIENENNALLIDRMAELQGKAVPDTYQTGLQLTEALQGALDARRNQIGSLYKAAEQSAGRKAEFDIPKFVNAANDTLDQKNLGAFLPNEIRTVLNNIASGKTPLTVDVAEQYKTILATAQRGANDGNARAAIGAVRDALENAPLRSDVGFGKESLDAFNAARAEFRKFRAEVEGNKALKLIENGASPDEFFRKGVLAAPAAELKQTMSLLPPEVQNQVKAQVVEYFKDKAGVLGADTSRLSGRQMEKVLKDFGTARLAAVFTPEEIAQLKRIGRVATFEQFQPVGSAVNNSNTATTAGGMLLNMAASPFLRKIPILGPNLGEPMQNIQAGMQAGRALNAGQSVAQPRMLPGPSVPLYPVPTLGLLAPDQ